MTTTTSTTTSKFTISSQIYSKSSNNNRRSDGPESSACPNKLVEDERGEFIIITMGKLKGNHFRLSELASSQASSLASWLADWLARWLARWPASSPRFEWLRRTLSERAYFCLACHQRLASLARLAINFTWPC